MELARRLAASAGVIIHQLLPIPPTTPLSGPSTSTFRRPARLGGDSGSARLISPAAVEPRRQLQRPRRAQLLRRLQLQPLRAVITRLPPAPVRLFRAPLIRVTTSMMAI